MADFKELKDFKPMTRDELYIEYPKLFKQIGLPESKSCMHWGMAIGDGWVSLIQDLSKCLNSYDGVEYAQIKEKFGVLQVYLYFNDDVSKETKEICKRYVDTYSQYSREKCEVCGAKGTHGVTNGWLSTLCPTHRQAKEKQNVE